MAGGVRADAWIDNRRHRVREISPMTAQAGRTASAKLLAGVGAATAAAHIGNNFTTFLIGGLMDRYGFTPVQMGAWTMVETLSYAAAMFVVAPRVASLSPRLLMLVAGVIVAAAQLLSAATGDYPLLLAARLGTGLGFGLANTALNLAAGRSTNPARAISAGIACQTVVYAAINIGLPMIGARVGVHGMFAALAGFTALCTGFAWTLPGRTPAARATAEAETLHTPDGADRWRVLAAMALFTFGSLAIWQFVERAAHAIGVSAVDYGRYQSIATLASAASNIVLAVLVTRLRRAVPLAVALLACGLSCAALTTVPSAWGFALALLIFNMSWFVSYPLLLGIGYAVDPSGRLAVLCSAAWLLMMSFGSLATGVIAQVLGGYRIVGPLGLLFCIAAILVMWPLVRRLDKDRPRGAARRPVGALQH